MVGAYALKYRNLGYTYTQEIRVRHIKPMAPVDEKNANRLQLQLIAMIVLAQGLASTVTDESQRLGLV